MAENSYTFAIIVILGLVALFLIYWFTTSRVTCRKPQEMNQTLEGYENMQNVLNTDADGVKVSAQMPNIPKEDLYKFAHAQDYPPETKKPMNSDLVGQGKASEYSMNPALTQLRQAACFPKEMLTPEELKPQDNSSLWAQVNPEGEGSLKGRSFLQAGHHIGINTVGQTLRNANLQLRSEPPNPQVLVSPWNQTTIEPDVNRRPLEIGGCS